MITLRKATLDNLDEVKQLYKQSIALHAPWVFAPQDYVTYLNQENRYFVCSSENGDIIGTFHISGIVRGYFQSAYLGYEVFAPYQGKGYMSKGHCLTIKRSIWNAEFAPA